MSLLSLYTIILLNPLITILQTALLAWG